MSPRRSTWLRVAGTSGIITPIAAFTCILLAIALSPHFSWTENALSDLGIMAGPTSILFNLGLIISGIMLLLFASGLFTFFEKNLLGLVGNFLFVLDSLALIAIGIFPENAKPMHFYASVAFFVLFAVGMFFLTASFLLASAVRIGLFTLSTAMFATVVWVAEFLLRYVPGVAIPEALSAISGSLWTMVVAFNMIKAASNPDE